jgi:hypothetical protein
MSVASPLLFTPNSSFAYPFQFSGTVKSTSAQSASPFTNRQESYNEVEQFISTIEQSQSLRITGGEIGRSSILKSSGPLRSNNMVM